MAVLTHLQQLEAESIEIMREVVAQVDNPVMLYSIGKDSAAMLHVAKKAFFPRLRHFRSCMSIRHGNFRICINCAKKRPMMRGWNCLCIKIRRPRRKALTRLTMARLHTDMWKTEGLKQALDKYQFDAAFGGARRDEEKSRAKERIFSFRSENHQWDPKNQRPELWTLYNARKKPGESMRVFPMSNWTELDIWQYIRLEKIEIVPLYFAAARPTVERDGLILMVDDERFPLNEGETPVMRSVRFRTLGCYPLTGAVESEAATLDEVIQEMLLTTTSERQGRAIDQEAGASMEVKKQQGYF